jgi:hypothetical protein
LNAFWKIVSLAVEERRRWKNHKRIRKQRLAARVEIACKDVEASEFTGRIRDTV